MKMAKASSADLDMAMDIANVLEDLERGYFPTKLQSDEDAESEEVEWIDTNDRKQYERLIFGLKHLLDKGSIGRVIWGMAVICDPSNECIDPDASTIEHHPKRQQLEKQVELANQQCDELLVALEGFVQWATDETMPTREAMEPARAAIASVRKSQGRCYYAPDGTLMNPDGTRSIFDDVDH